MPEPTKEELETSREDGVSMFRVEDVEKRRIWRTLDIHVLPLVSLLYLMSFL
jgi:hypothetical protein